MEYFLKGSINEHSRIGDQHETREVNEGAIFRTFVKISKSNSSTGKIHVLEIKINEFSIKISHTFFSRVSS